MIRQDEQKAKDGHSDLTHASSATYTPYFETPEVRRSECLSLQEETAKRKEDNLNASAKFRWKGQEELTKIRLGRLMHMNEFLRLLRKIVPCEYNDFSAVGMRGLNVIQNTLEGKKLTYVCAVQNGWMPEYSTMREDEYGRPTNEKYRGWRTVLTRLILGGFITNEQADKVFGKPDRQGDLYQAGIASSSRKRQANSVRNRHGG